MGTKVGRTRRRNRYIDGNQLSRPPADCRKVSRRGKRQFLRARFYRGAKIRFLLILPLRESCWGVPSPNPAYAAYAAGKSLKIIFGFFKNGSASHSVFRLLVRGHHTQKGGLPTMKRYNTLHHSRVVKTRMTEEEYAGEVRAADTEGGLPHFFP